MREGGFLHPNNSLSQIENIKQLEEITNKTSVYNILFFVRDVQVM